MDIDEAWRATLPLTGRRFREYMPPDDMSYMRRNKGRAGQLLEKAIGLPLSTALMDFPDGDLKSYKCDRLGIPLETMAIHAVGNEIDDLVARQSFASSSVHCKTQRLIVLGVCKVAGDPGDWFVACRSLVDARPGTSWYQKFERSYEQILDRFHAHLSSSGRFHTSSGTYIQLRTKDSKPYKQLYSSIRNDLISDKNIAFYFKKTFMEQLL